MAVNRSGSILAVDFGSVTTRAILIDLVDGVYRLVARGESRTTNTYPAGDIQLGMNRALAMIRDVTDRRLLNEQGRLITPEQNDRSGVDHLVATASTGRTLRTILVGLVPEVSIASGLRATAGTYVEVVEVISLADGRDEEGRLNAILLNRPDLVFIVGGTEDGADTPVLALAENVRLALSLLERSQRPSVLFAGNTSLMPRIQALFADVATLFTATNVRPSIEEEKIEESQTRLAQAFDNRQALQGGGFERVGEISRVGVLPTAQSYSLMASYLGQTVDSGGVLIVDVGSAVSTMAAWLNGHLTTTIRTDLGLGHSAANLVEAVEEDQVARWLPFYPAHDEIREYVLNKTLRPATLPETQRELYLEHALLRAGVNAMITAALPTWHHTVTAASEMPFFGHVIGAGAGLTRTGDAGLNALLLLDTVQPTGAVRLATDPYGVLVALGAVARISPEIVVQVLDTGGLEQIGMCVSVSGQPAVNHTAMRVKITLANGQVIKQEVQGGHLWRYPLAEGETAQVEVRVARRDLHIGGKSRVKMTVTGGHAGLIFDGRGRPLPLALTPQGRAAQMPLWVAELTGTPIREIDPQWLAPPVEEIAEPVAVPKPDKKAKSKKEKPPKKSRGDKGGQKPVIATADDDGIFDLRDLDDDDQTDDTLNELNKLRG